MMNRLLPMISLLAFVSGCSLFTPREGTTPEQRQGLVKGAATLATFAAITESFDGNKPKQVALATEVLNIANTALGVLNDPNTVLTPKLKDELFGNIPTKYRPYLNVAFDTFNTYYVVSSADKVLTPEQLGLLKAFFTGVHDGATNVITVDTE